MIGVDIAAIIVAIVSVIIACFAWWNSRLAARHQIVSSLLDSYRSAEMLSAIEGLIEFRDRCKKESESRGCAIEKYMKCEHERIKNEDLGRLKQLKPSDKFDYLRTTLHYQRRLVAHFYWHLYVIVTQIPGLKKHIFDLWPCGSLHLIPEVLVPIGYDPDKGLVKLHCIAAEYRKRTESCNFD